MPRKDGTYTWLAPLSRPPPIVDHLRRDVHTAAQITAVRGCEIMPGLSLPSCMTAMHGRTYAAVAVFHRPPPTKAYLRVKHINRSQRRNDGQQEETHACTNGRESKPSKRVRPSARPPPQGTPSTAAVDATATHFRRELGYVLNTTPLVRNVLALGRVLHATSNCPEPVAIANATRQPGAARQRAACEFWRGRFPRQPHSTRTKRSPRDETGSQHVRFFHDVVRTATDRGVTAHPLRTRASQCGRQEQSILRGRPSTHNERAQTNANTQYPGRLRAGDNKRTPTRNTQAGCVPATTNERQHAIPRQAACCVPAKKAQYP
jgi:hypothetical protein